jgi:beta-lactamase regulating signal transducer with metallopeptidase domain
MTIPNLSIILTVAQSTLIALLAGGVFWMVLRRFRGVSPNVHRVIWFGVILLGLCIVRWPVNIPYYEPEAEVTVQMAPQVVPMEMNREREPAMMIPDLPALASNPVHDVVPTSIASQGNAANVNPTYNTAFTFTSILFAIWLTGVIVLLARRIVLHILLHRQLRTLRQCTAPDWSRLLMQFGIAPERIPMVWTDDEEENSAFSGVGPALVWSLSGHKLLFPRSLWDELSPPHREGVLRHELSHYLSGDAWLAELARLLATLQWFNPVAWLALRKWEEATEWRCDDFAWFHCPRGPRELIETLLAVHESTESLGLYVTSFARNNVITRIKRLHENHSHPEKENTLMKKIVLLSLSLTFLLATATQVRLVAKPQEVKDTTPPEPVAVVATEEKPVIPPATDATLAVEPSEPQIVFQMLFAEVNQEALGNRSSMQMLMEAGSPDITQEVIFTASHDAMKVLLASLEKEKMITVLSKPQIMTVENEMAIVFVGSKEKNILVEVIPRIIGDRILAAITLKRDVDDNTKNAKTEFNTQVMLQENVTWFASMKLKSDDIETEKEILLCVTANIVRPEPPKVKPQMEKIFSGQVFMPDGTPARNATVHFALYENPDVMFLLSSRKTDENGHYEVEVESFKNFVPRFVLCYATLSDENDVPLPYVSEPVDFMYNGNPAVVYRELTKVFPVTGVVRYPDGSPAENSDAFFRLKMKFTSLSLARWAKPNEQGEFTMYLTPREYEFKVNSPRCEERGMRNYANQPNPNNSPLINITIGSDGPVDLGEIVLPRMPDAE